MYTNIGKKIKCLAVVMFLIESIVSVIVGIALMIIAAKNDNNKLILFGLLEIVIVSLFAWVSSWLLYAFGQLVENSDIISNTYKCTNDQAKESVTKNKKIKDKHQETFNIQNNEGVQKEEYVDVKLENLDFDEDGYLDIVCSNCKAKLSFTEDQLKNDRKVKCPMCDNPVKIQV